MKKEIRYTFHARKFKTDSFTTRNSARIPWQRSPNFSSENAFNRIPCTITHNSSSLPEERERERKKKKIKIRRHRVGDGNSGNRFNPSSSSFWRSFNPLGRGEEEEEKEEVTDGFASWFSARLRNDVFAGRRREAP